MKEDNLNKYCSFFADIKDLIRDLSPFELIVFCFVAGALSLMVVGLCYLLLVFPWNLGIAFGITTNIGFLIPVIAIIYVRLNVNK